MKTALHEAVESRKVDDVERLLREGADPNALDASGQPPLRYVLTYGVGFVLEKETERMIHALLNAGANPQLAQVGEALSKDASSMVCSAGEAGEADRLCRILGEPLSR